MRSIQKQIDDLIRLGKRPSITLFPCATLLLPKASMHGRLWTLGHSQVSLTLNTYSHVLPLLQRAAAAKMDDILSNG